jgi:hypothetical protein
MVSTMKNTIKRLKCHLSWNVKVKSSSLHMFFYNRQSGKYHQNKKHNCNISNLNWNKILNLIIFIYSINWIMSYRGSHQMSPLFFYIFLGLRLFFSPFEINTHTHLHTDMTLRYILSIFMCLNNTSH